MPPQQAAVAGGGQGQQQPQQKSNTIFGILRMVAMWYMFKTFFGGGSLKKLERGELFAPHFPKGTSLDMSVYLSESPSFRDFAGSKPIWQEADMQLGLAGERKLNVTYRPSQVRLSSEHLTYCIPPTAFDRHDSEACCCGHKPKSSLPSSTMVRFMAVRMTCCFAGCPDKRVCLLARLLRAKRPCLGPN